jgi:hypothetical protein
LGRGDLTPRSPASSTVGTSFRAQRFSRSSSRLGCVGSHPKVSRVIALDAGQSQTVSVECEPAGDGTVLVARGLADVRCRDQA